MSTEFWVGKNETTLDAISDADLLMKVAPDYYGPRFEAIYELRKQDDGTLHRGAGFRRVASLVNVPLLAAMKVVDPEFMLNKERFYRWLNKHPQYKTYDKRGGSRPRVTFHDGQQVAG